MRLLKKFNQVCALMILGLFLVSVSTAQAFVFQEKISTSKSLAHYAMGQIFDMLGLSNQAIMEYEKAARYDEGSYLIHLRLGADYARIGLLDEAGVYLERARAASPDKQHILETLAQYYFTVGDTEDGLAALLHAYEVAPQFEGPAAVYAAGLIRTGNTAGAEEFLMKAFGTTTVSHSSVINAYVSVGNLQKVHDLWEARLAQDPEDAAAHLSLAAVLAEEGDAAEAVAHVEQALALDPGLQPQADHLLGRMTEAGMIQ